MFLENAFSVLIHYDPGLEFQRGERNKTPEANDRQDYGKQAGGLLQLTAVG